MRAMLQSHPNPTDHLDVRSKAIMAALECAAHCLSCADACLAEDSVDELRQCIRTDEDCAQVCLTTATLLSRQTEERAATLRSQLETCISHCEACATECEGHADHHEHCRLCAEACRTCAQACRAMLDALG
jgi:hypothetical protein